MDASEREQYRAAIHGDREAFKMIIRTHSRALFAIAYGILQNREEAEDVVQDSLVKAWKTRWRVRDPEKFPAWLATIARHRAHDIFRKRRNVSLSEQIAEPIEQEPNDTTALDQQLHSALAALPELHRTALTLRYLEETLAQEKPDPAFEQRMLSSFRSRIPQRRSGFPGSPRDESVRLADWIVDLMRLRAVQFTAVAAILVALVQMGRMITGENATALRPRERYAREQSV